MDSYTITIAANDDSGAATRLIVDTTGGQVRITDMHLHAPHGLSSGHIPAVDIDLLLRAVTGTSTVPNGHRVAGATALDAPRDAPALEAATTTMPAGEPPVATTAKRRAHRTTPRATATPPSASTPAPSDTTASDGKPATRRRSARAVTTPANRTVQQPPATTTAKAAATTAPTPAARKHTATPGAAAATRRTPAKRTRTPANRTRTAAPITTTSATSGRVYRRVPDDLPAVFERIGTVSGIAAHYKVPRYTAQGWISRLRATA